MSEEIIGEIVEIEDGLNGSPSQGFRGILKIKADTVIYKVEISNINSTDIELFRKGREIRFIGVINNEKMIIEEPKDIWIKMK